MSHWVNSILRPFGVRLSSIVSKDESGRAKRFLNKFSLDDSYDGTLDIEVRKVLNLLHYTKSSGSSYSADVFDSGYHTIELDGVTYVGQRKPEERLSEIPFDFKDTVVLDIGSNQGGMLFQIAHEIHHGVGLDYDVRMINAANRIKAHQKLSNLDFFVFDLENDPLAYIDNLLPARKVDIVFLLSVCMWIENWRGVIKKARTLADNMLFETNGTKEEQAQQVEELRKQYSLVEMIRSSSPDDPGQQSRMLYLCRA